MDLEQILAGLREGVALATRVADPLAAMGVPYAGVIKATLEVAQNLDKRIQEGVVVATEKDRHHVQELITNLQAANDRLAAEIDRS